MPSSITLALGFLAPLGMTTALYCTGITRIRRTVIIRLAAQMPTHQHQVFRSSAKVRLSSVAGGRALPGVTGLFDPSVPRRPRGVARCVQIGNGCRFGIATAWREAWRTP